MDYFSHYWITGNKKPTAGFQCLPTESTFVFLSLTFWGVKSHICEKWSWPPLWTKIKKPSKKVLLYGCSNGSLDILWHLLFLLYNKWHTSTPSTWKIKSSAIISELLLSVYQFHFSHLYLNLTCTLDKVFDSTGGLNGMKLWDPIQRMVKSIKLSVITVEPCTWYLISLTVLLSSFICTLNKRRKGFTELLFETSNPQKW